MRRVGIFWTAALIAGWTGEARAQLTETYQDWVVRCATPSGGQARACEAVQDVRRPGSDERISGAVVTIDRGGQTQATLLTPLGISLPPGVELFRDAEAAPLTRLSFALCRREGCLIRTSLSPALLSAFQRGTAIRMRVRAEGGGSADLPISLRGFTAAHGRLLELAR